VSVVGPLMLALSFGLAVAIWMAMVSAGDVNTPYVQRFFDWMVTGDLKISWAFQVDQLSMIMVLVITGVGTLIHIFSVGYMREIRDTRATSPISICSCSSCSSLFSERATH
jgi:NADH:ubiquinone oxidoreductase subunit 5 (chain L)/Multisubunit Na+/H+ antiporter, MnhA subunit